MPFTEIPRIVAACRARNGERAITGVLLFTGRDFAQLIEGAPDTVTMLWARLRADDRHGDIVVLLDERVPQRWFADWRVGFPTDTALVGRIAAWRAAAPVADVTAWGDVRRIFTAADAL
jgi:hypothetical protein